MKRTVNCCTLLTKLEVDYQSSQVLSYFDLLKIIGVFSPIFFCSVFSASHRFYVAFENSLCKDYVTEKYFLRLSQLLVPVVLKREILEGKNS